MWIGCWKFISERAQLWAGAQALQNSSAFMERKGEDDDGAEREGSEPGEDGAEIGENDEEKEVEEKDKEVEEKGEEKDVEKEADEKAGEDNPDEGAGMQCTSYDDSQALEVNLESFRTEERGGRLRFFAQRALL